MSELEDIQSRMQDICTFIADSTAKIEAGELVSFSGLDGDVAVLCERAASLPPEDVEQIQPLMTDMITSLETLAAALKKYQILDFPQGTS